MCKQFYFLLHLHPKRGSKCYKVCASIRGDNPIFRLATTLYYSGNTWVSLDSLTQICQKKTLFAWCYWVSFPHNQFLWLTNKRTECVTIIFYCRAIATHHAIAVVQFKLYRPIGYFTSEFSWTWLMKLGRDFRPVSNTTPSNYHGILNSYYVK